ncbi:hypothetical protein ACHAQH_005041 [Verticillium albo-atrum]
MVRPPSRESGYSLPPAYSFADELGHGENQFLVPDPRRTSTQSLTPSSIGGDDTETRRTLLVVYIHGFYGNDQSFQSFPAHVHNYLKNELSDNYVIHSKIYPRYKTYKAITLARDNFSSWLQPHESPTTDVVLVGHSMGGLLAADVALMPTNDPFFNPSYFNDIPFREQPFKKRLLHFVKKHSSEGVFGAARNHVLSHLEYGGCLADYPALNSRYSRIRALEDVDELQALRQQTRGATTSRNQPAARVRFVNYYTISTGRPKKAKSKSRNPSRNPSPEVDATGRLLEPAPVEEAELLVTPAMPTPDGDVATPGIQVAEPSGAEEKILSPTEGIKTEERSPHKAPMQYLDPFPASSDVADNEHVTLSHSTLTQHDDDSTFDLPAIPDLPLRPVSPDLDACPDKDAQRQAEKEAKRELKAYEQAVKNRDKAIKERQKLADKRRKKAEKEAHKAEKEQAKGGTREQAQRDAEAEQRQQEAEQRASEAADREREAAKRAGRLAPVVAPEPEQQQQHNEQREEIDQVTEQGQETSPPRGRAAPADHEARTIDAEKPAKERKFCVLPRRVGEGKDNTWVSIFMEGVDEVGAHCGLFFPGAHYEDLVGNLGRRVVEWAQESLSNRAILELAQSTDDLRVD